MERHQIAWLFPGQGSQEVGMGETLAKEHAIARRTFEEAEELLGFALSDLMWNGPEEALHDTINTQPALYVHSLALVRTAQAEGVLPEAGWVAGHSLGEYSALAAAGALSFPDGLRLVRERGRLMKEAGRRHPGGMAAIIGLTDVDVTQLCIEAGTATEPVQVANYNCPGQVVISGAKAAVLRASDAAKNAGARKVVPLDVSIAAHSPLMVSAQEEFAEFLANIPVSDPVVPVIGNVTARPLQSATEIKEEMLAQLTGSVRWTDSMHYLLEQGVTTFLELGPGGVLTGLMKRIDRSAIRYSVSTWQELLALQAEIGE